jgi:hypothetical protein
VADRSELQGRVDRLIGAPDRRAGEEQFGPFVEDHLERAGQLAGELIRIAEEESPNAALAEAEGSTEMPGVVQHAVKLMITHSPAARAELSVPTVETEPADKASEATRAPALPAVQVMPVPNPDTQPAAERALDWYRQDPRANDHHSHWHNVYPSRPPEGMLSQKRQGELFLYMHQQMMARYDTERAIAGLPGVASFEPVPQGSSETYSRSIPEGSGLPGYTTRPVGQTLHDVLLHLSSGDVTVKPTVAGAAHVRIAQAIRDKLVDLVAGGTHALTTALLGAATESSRGRNPDAAQDMVLKGYGSLHNNGHVLVSMVIDPPSGTRPGLMWAFNTAICDPFFYRWHGHVDDIYASYQETLGANTYDQFAAKVRFRGHDDIGLVLSRDVQAPDGDFGAWARRTFGDDPATFGAPATDQLLTRFVSSIVKLPWDTPAGPGGTLFDGAMLLEHEPFFTVLRIENLLPQKQDVTVRLYLAHTGMASNRRRWIELDKFHVVLEPGVNVVAQPDARSSVIKRKGLTALGALPTEDPEHPLWCDCGWPFGLLIPSGESSAAGTSFELMAAVTDWSQDHANDATTCGSMSFCGALDDYPDARAMGYPFDRPFPGGDPRETIQANDTMTLRPFSVRCETPHPGAAPA